VTTAALRVLIIEDEADLAEVFHDYIVSRGHTAEVVGSAEQALERLHAAPPDVIILDVKLPGMSGLQLMSLPAVRQAAIPVIVVSGHATEYEALACLRLGALEFLAKPVRLEILGAVLEHAAIFAEREAAGHPERRMTGRFPIKLPVRMVNEKARWPAARRWRSARPGCAPGWTPRCRPARRCACRSRCPITADRWTSSR
jgi:DNA-binding NtrC family response regulator